MHLCTRLVCTAFDEIEQQFSRYRSMKQKAIQDIAYTQKLSSSLILSHAVN